ncbi:hypothetical protein KI387_026892, partial [Taxus chinensis]
KCLNLISSHGMPYLRALLEVELIADKIHAVEVVGSGSRVPSIMKILIDFFGKEPRRTKYNPHLKKIVMFYCSMSKKPLEALQELEIPHIDFVNKSLSLHLSNDPYVPLVNFGWIDLEGTVYTISKGTLKYVKIGYRDSSSPWEIMLEMDSILDICTKPTAYIPITTFHFTPISAVQKIPLGATMDVLGAITFCSGISTSTQPDGSSTQLSTITMKDHNGYFITITLWGVLCDEANNILQPQQGQLAVAMPILAVRKAKTTEFRGRTLTSVPSTQLFVVPAVPEIESLQIWLTTTEASTSVALLTTQAAVEKNIVDIHAFTSPNPNQQIAT